MPDTPITQRDVEALRVTLDKLDRTVSSLPDRIEATYVRQDVYAGDRELQAQAVAALRREVDEHSAWLVWGLRIVVAAVIVALLGTVLVQRGAV